MARAARGPTLAPGRAVAAGAHAARPGTAAVRPPATSGEIEPLAALDRLLEGSGRRRDASTVVASTCDVRSITPSRRVTQQLRYARVASLLRAMPVGAWHNPVVWLPSTLIWAFAALPRATPVSVQVMRCTASAPRDTAYDTVEFGMKSMSTRSPITKRGRVVT